METLRLKNYRCFEDTGDIRIKPITVLLGANSSGKSSFLKFFPLLKQSAGIRKEGVFLWYSEDVDFKDFKNTVKDGKGNIVIDMGIQFKDHVTPSDKSFMRFLEEKHLTYKGELVHVELTISKLGANTDYLERLKYTYLDQECEIQFTSKNIKSITINGEDMMVGDCYHLMPTHQIIPRFTIRIPSSKSVGESLNLIKQRVISEIRTYSESIDMNVIDGVFDRAFYLLKKDVFKQYIAKEFKIELKDERLNNLYILANINELLEMTNYRLMSYAMQMSYVRPLRIMPERYYRYQNYSIEEISSDGKNLAMYFANLTEDNLKAFNKWTSDNFKFSIKLNKSEGHVEIEIKEGNKQSHNMVDTGFGYNQLLPILAIIWNSQGKRNRYYYRIEDGIKFIVIEQPELHLHPRLMSMFAEMLCSAIINQKENEDIRFIIETHSDALINKFGSLINSSVISPDKINVVMFNAKEEGMDNYVEQVSYDKSGYIPNWPLGFFS